MRQYQYPVTGNRTEYLELTSSDKFITVLNNSDYTVNIYKERGINSSNLLMKIPIYTGITIPLEKTSIITIEMTGSSQAQISIVLSEENLNVNQNFITPSGYQNVSIVSPLPAGANNIGKVDVNSLPILPSGTNNIGKVDVNSLPAVKLSGGNYVNITTATTTLVKTGSGILKRIIINNPGSAMSITIYDNTSGTGTKIATISSVSGINFLEFNSNFVTGLTVVTTATTMGDITIIYE